MMSRQVVEPAEGCAADGGVAVLIVEQHVEAALALADRGYVMETGRITMNGPAQDLIADPRIREAYLGI